MNLKVLSEDELKYFLDRYTIKIVGSYVLVHCENPKRNTVHNMNDSFSLTTPVRKIKISKDAINYWKDVFMDKYSLIEVQNAMNFLQITYRTVNISQLTKQLKKMNQNITM